MKKIKLAALLMTLLLCMACGGKQTKGKVVSVTIEPQRFFAERILVLPLYADIKEDDIHTISKIIRG